MEINSKQVYSAIVRHDYSSQRRRSANAVFWFGPRPARRLGGGVIQWHGDAPRVCTFYNHRGGYTTYIFVSAKAWLIAAGCVRWHATVVVANESIHRQGVIIPFTFACPRYRWPPSFTCNIMHAYRVRPGSDQLTKNAGRCKSRVRT